MNPSSSSTISSESSLRRHLQTVLEELPNNLPPYDEDRVLDDLCFLFRSSIYLYVISPRLHQTKRGPQPSETGVMTPESMEGGDFQKEQYPRADGINFSKLNMSIRWDSDSWVTQLRYSDSTLLEGRQYTTSQEAGFVQSFYWFCEEARFLWYEFQAREKAAAVAAAFRMGMAVESSTELDLAKDEVNGETRAQVGGERKKKRRVLKLKIRLWNSNRESLHSAAAQ